MMSRNPACSCPVGPLSGLLSALLVLIVQSTSISSPLGSSMRPDLALIENTTRVRYFLWSCDSASHRPRTQRKELAEERRLQREKTSQQRWTALAAHHLRLPATEDGEFSRQGTEHLAPTAFLSHVHALKYTAQRVLCTGQSHVKTIIGDKKKPAWKGSSTNIIDTVHDWATPADWVSWREATLNLERFALAGQQ